MKNTLVHFVIFLFLNFYKISQNRKKVRVDRGKMEKGEGVKMLPPPGRL